MSGDSYVPLTTQQNLWEPSCATNCSLWSACGGSPAAAPCGCIHTDPEDRYDCQNCEIICRARRAPGEPRPPAGAEGCGFKKRLPKGQALELLKVDQPAIASTLPLLIPYHTEKTAGHGVLPLSWAAVSAKMLFTYMSTTRPAHLRRYLFDSRHQVRRYLNLHHDTRLLAVLNGTDLLLEGLWGMEDRTVLYQAMEEAGFWGLTGPTFSVNEESQSHPASHNVLMLQRHHRVIEEANSTSLVAVPNVYWRGAQDLQRWTEWLRKHTSVNAISMDFSRTTNWSSFYRPFPVLLDLLDRVGRPLHVLLVGIGRVKAGKVIQMLSRYGATVSVLTANPVIDGERGRRWKYRDRQPPELIRDLSVPKSELAARNLHVMGRHLQTVAAALPLYDDNATNGRLP